MSLITARLLGPVQVTVEGTSAPADLLWKKHLAVCLVLWEQGDRGISRERLIALIWSNKQEQAARHSLNEALRVIRRTAGADSITTASDQLSWRGRLERDVDRFASSEAADPERAAGLVDGVYCEGFAVAGEAEFELWIESRRRDWTNRTVKVLLHAARLTEARSAADRTLVFAGRAAALEPWSDAPARALIRAKWLGGDRIGALIEGRNFASRLDAELQVEPDSLTKALIARIAAGRTPPVDPILTEPSRRPPFFGQRKIMERSRAILGGVASSNQPAMITLLGAPGSGRSRLMEEMVLRAVLDGSSVITMRAVEADALNADALWLGLARGGLLDAPGVLAAPAEAIGALSAASGEWRQRFAVTAVTAIPLVEAVTLTLRAVADERPVLLAIDDAHRLGEDGLRRLPQLLRALAGRAIGLVMTLNLGQPSQAVDELCRTASRDFAGASLRLDSWDIDSVCELVGWSLPRWDRVDQHRLARRLHAESDGRPAIAVELLAGLQESFLETQDEATWPAPDRTLDATMPTSMPPVLIAAVRIAFGRLQPPEQTLLVIAALLPEPIDPAALQHLVDGMTRPEMEATLDRLEWERWLVADGRGYSFPARTLRRLLADEMITPGKRRRLLERIEGIANMPE